MPRASKFQTVSTLPRDSAGRLTSDARGPREPNKHKPLCHAHKTFCGYVARGFSPAEAYVQSGHPDVEPRTARIAGNKILSDPRVQVLIETLQREGQERTEITIARIMRGLLAEAESDENNSSDRISAWRALAAMVPGALAPARAQVAVVATAVGAVQDLGLSAAAEDRIFGEILGIPRALPPVDAEFSIRDQAPVVDSGTAD